MGMNICFPTGGIEVSDSLINEKLGITDGLYKVSETKELYARFTADKSGGIILMSLDEPRAGLRINKCGIDWIAEKLYEAGLVNGVSAWYLKKDGHTDTSLCAIYFNIGCIKDNKTEFYEELVNQFGRGGNVSYDRDGNVTKFALRTDYGMLTYEMLQLKFELNNAKYAKDVDWSKLTVEGLGQLYESLNWLIKDNTFESSLIVGVEKFGCGCCGGKCGCQSK